MIEHDQDTDDEELTLDTLVICPRKWNEPCEGCPYLDLCFEVYDDED